MHDIRVISSIFFWVISSSAVMALSVFEKVQTPSFLEIGGTELLIILNHIHVNDTQQPTNILNSSPLKKRKNRLFMLKKTQLKDKTCTFWFYWVCTRNYDKASDHVAHRTIISNTHSNARSSSVANYFMYIMQINNHRIR